MQPSCWSPLGQTLVSGAIHCVIVHGQTSFLDGTLSRVNMLEHPILFSRSCNLDLWHKCDDMSFLFLPHLGSLMSLSFDPS
ncbi:hypothetical protein C8R42DRAFT_660857 [Lentinula raphanica]|nr:hypothetical protein C8R42DRAFT_660857 [Lentinula raphanica]